MIQFSNVYSGTITEKPNNALNNDDTYRASSVCQYRLRNLKYATGYDVIFTKFDLKVGDYVEFYDFADENKALITRFDINNMPHGFINIPSKDVVVKFVADNDIQGTGFQMNFAGVMGIDDHNFEDVALYPNPATDNLFVKLTAEAQDVNATVVDLTGKVVLTELFNHNGGMQQYTLPVSTLSSGIYFLNLQGKDSGKATYKFIVK